MSELSYKLSLELEKRGYKDKKALGYLDAIQDLQKIDEQPPLNDNQQIVLDWAKSYLSEAKNIGWFIEELAFLPTTGGKMRYKEVAYVYESLSSQEKIGFLNAVIAWALEQEGK